MGKNLHIHRKLEAFLDMKNLAWSFYGFHTIDCTTTSKSNCSSRNILMLVGFGIYANLGLGNRVFGLEVSTFMGT
jgi:hypothetical protein